MNKEDLHNNIINTKRNISPLAFSLKRSIKQNKKLREQLFEATTKQHQEMSRAIILKQKNLSLQKQIQFTKIEIDELKNLHRQLSNRQFASEIQNLYTR